MLEINNLTKIFKNNTKALDDVSFRINKGEFAALLGQNGAGKSTLISILAGNVKKNSGKIIVRGYDLDRDELMTKRILGIVPQEISFDHFFTVQEVLENQSGYFGIKNNKKTIDDLLEILSLGDKRNVNTKELSGGMKRRLLIAKALVHKPEILILDEPTAGVDIELRISMHEFLRDLNRTGITVILTTHYLEEAEKLCGRIIIIHQGRIIMDAPKERIMNNKDDVFIEFNYDGDLKSDKLGFLSGYFPLVRDNRLRLSAQPEDIPDLFKKMEDNRIRYKNIRFENKKLEDVFLKLINH
jgi:ABC-2 type transport system ATP-binding protein